MFNEDPTGQELESAHKNVGGRNPRRQCFSVTVTKRHGWYLKVKMVIWANTGDEEMSPQDVYLNK